MKNKLKIMNKRQVITDEEIERFKDFDALLVKHHQITTTGSKPWIKWTALVMTVLSVTAVIFYFNSRESNSIKQESTMQETLQSLNQKEEKLALEEEMKKEQKDEEQKLQAKSNEEIKVKQSNKKVTDTDVQEIQEVKSVTPVYIQAEPVDGYANLYEYFNRELVYPEVAVKDSIQGVLTISFIINRQGVAENFQFSNSLGKPFEEEVIRLVQNMPPWKPATLNGEAVPSKMSLPLTFQIQAITENKEK